MGSESAPLLHIDIVETTFENSVDGLTYVAPDGWKQYRREHIVPRPATEHGDNKEAINTRVKLSGRTTFLSNPLPGDCDGAQLAKWVLSLESAIETQLASAPG
jgi:hypothetical protein